MATNFGDVPIELREKVYRYSMVLKRKACKFNSPTLPGPGRIILEVITCNTDLLLSNRQIYEECKHTISRHSNTLEVVMPGLRVDFFADFAWAIADHLPAWISASMKKVVMTSADEYFDDRYLCMVDDAKGQFNLWWILR